MTLTGVGFDNGRGIHFKGDSREENGKVEIGDGIENFCLRCTILT